MHLNHQPKGLAKSLQRCMPCHMQARRWLVGHRTSTSASGPTLPVLVTNVVNAMENILQANPRKGPNEKNQVAVVSDGFGEDVIGS